MSDSAGNTTAATGRHHGFPSYPKLKPSGVEWLGDVPEHWEVAPLCRLTSSIKASNVDKHIRSNQLPVRLCNYRDVYYNDGIDFDDRYMRGSATAKQVECLQLRKGDVLITKDSEVHDDIGVPSLVLEDVPDLVAGYHLALLRPDLRYLYGPYLFRALQSDIASLQFTHRAQGVTRYGLTYPGIRSVRLPVPPIIEQRAIANYLDRETAKIDTLIARNEALIKRLKEHRAALISRTVTRGLPPAECRKAGIDPHPKLKPSGVEWPGNVPEHWDVVPVKRHYDVRLGKMLQTGPGTSSDQHVTYLKAKHVQWFSIHGDSLPRMWASRHDMEHFSIRSGDLLVCEGGEGGRSAIVREITTGPHIIQNALHRVRPHDDDGSYNPWLQYVLSVAASVGLLKAINNKATIAHFTADKFKALMIPMPPQGEANLLVAYLDGNTARINKATLLARREIDLLREYRARLIAEVITGEMDVYSLAARDMEAAT